MPRTDDQEPSPADIRPLHILKETLQLLKRKWKDNHNYAYALDQFKSMRQDLTVSFYPDDGTKLMIGATYKE
jgi:hypothetical protein